MPRQRRKEPRPRSKRFEAVPHQRSRSRARRKRFEADSRYRLLRARLLPIAFCVHDNNNLVFGSVVPRKRSLKPTVATAYCVRGSFRSHSVCMTITTSYWEIGCAASAEEGAAHGVSGLKPCRISGAGAAHGVSGLKPTVATAYCVRGSFRSHSACMSITNSYWDRLCRVSERKEPRTE